MCTNARILSKAFFSTVENISGYGSSMTTFMASLFHPHVCEWLFQKVFCARIHFRVLFFRVGMCAGAVCKLRADVPDLNLHGHGHALDKRVAHERAASNQKAVAVLIPLERLLGCRGLLLAHRSSKHERAGAKNKESARHQVSQKTTKKKGEKRMKSITQGQESQKNCIAPHRLFSCCVFSYLPSMSFLTTFFDCLTFEKKSCWGHCL